MNNPLESTDVESLVSAPIGTKIKFVKEKGAYVIRARSRRFIVCTKPYNPKRTVIYTIIDLQEKVRGPENLIFGMGAETDQQCADMIDRLEGIYRFPTEVEKAKEDSEILAVKKKQKRLGVCWMTRFVNHAVHHSLLPRFHRVGVLI